MIPRSLVGRVRGDPALTAGAVGGAVGGAIASLAGLVGYVLVPFLLGDAPSLVEASVNAATTPDRFGVVHHVAVAVSLSAGATVEVSTLPVFVFFLYWALLLGLLALFVVATGLVIVQGTAAFIGYVCARVVLRVTGDASGRSGVEPDRPPADPDGN